MIGHRELALKITEWQNHEEKDKEGKERPKSRRQKKQANDHFHENGDIYEVDPNLLIGLVYHRRGNETILEKSAGIYSMLCSDMCFYVSQCNLVVQALRMIKNQNTSIRVSLVHLSNP